MTSPGSWPALQGASLDVPLALEQGVWGKVHGAASDFRWIARSPGLPAGLEHEIALGTEDAPCDGVAWRVLERHAVAVHFHPSRARDAAGRGGTLEKYVVVWPLDDARSAVVGALLLLPLVAAQGDGLWWERAAGQPWSDRNFSLPLPRLDVPALLDAAPGPEAIRRALRERLKLHEQRGLADLRGAGVDWLAGLYAALLAGGRPVRLAPPPRASLTPAALVSLLLPLPSASAARLSLCSWLPVTRPGAETLGGRFDLLLGAFAPEPEPGVRAVPDAVRAGRELAEKLIAAAQAAAAAGSSSPGDWSPDPWQRPRDMPLTPPPSGASTLIKRVYAFACDPARRWLSWAELSGERLSLSAAVGRHADVLQTWVEELRRYKPAVDEADRAAFDEHWRVKRDVLRALTLLAFPGLVQVEQFESKHVPPLLFVAALTRAGDLDALGEAKLDAAVRCTRECRPSPAKRAVERRLDEWRHSDALVGKLLRRAAPPSRP